MMDLRTFGLATAFVYSLTSCSGEGEKTTVVSGSAVESSAEETEVVNILGIEWTAPSMREDGDPLSLSEIQRYRIYYGNKTGDYQRQIDVVGSAAVVAEVEGIPSGTYYVVVTTIDTAGRESLYSSEVVVTI